MEVGRPTDLTSELTMQIRQGVLASKPYVEIQRELSISPNTWDSWVWRNTQGFRDNLTSWKHERMVKKAEANLDVLMESSSDKIKLDASVFMLETLGKTNYSKKTETDVTSGGKPIFLASEIIQKNGIDTSPSTERDSEGQPQI